MNATHKSDGWDRLRHQDIQQELEGINNQPPSEIIQFWKTDFTHYVIPI